MLRPSANSGKNSGKPLLDGGQGKKASTSRKGRLEKTAKTIKQTTANAPSGKSQKERLEEDRQQRRVTVQMQREPKRTPTTPKEPASVEARGRLTSRHLLEDQGLACGRVHPPRTDASDR